MSLKDDVQTLTDKVGNIEENTAQLGESTQLIADDVAALKQELIVANEKSNVDLSPLIERAGKIATSIGDVNTRLRDVAGPVAGSDPAAQPPDGGGTTTGGEPIG